MGNNCFPYLQYETKYNKSEIDITSLSDKEGAMHASSLCSERPIYAISSDQLRAALNASANINAPLRTDGSAPTKNEKTSK